ncbi:7350_t:CDS:2 [Ambispora gerdemannii]|uniref:Thiamine pyrophosphokinase n=1 Tax=Ambispora gerdemannii TaxID=144530 RepID=A0A9N8YXN3_9GLOM|nr:7350_t:CDS:2 [Ambispora gerdemannii]
MLAKDNEFQYWAPSLFLAVDDKNKKCSNQIEYRGLVDQRPYSLIILNQPISIGILDLLFLNEKIEAILRICADGGANRLYDVVKGTENETRYIPNYICGDIDSLRPDVAEYYKSKGTEIKGNPQDQDTTDFQKCIALLSLKEQEASLEYDIIGYGALGGRFDHTMSSIHILHQQINNDDIKKKEQQKRIYLLTDHDITMLLSEGKHNVFCDLSILGPTCGILPIGVSQAVITTTGLRWNLTKATTSFGNMISTSNQFNGEIVTIETDSPVIWTVELRK